MAEDTAGGARGAAEDTGATRQRGTIMRVVRYAETDQGDGKIVQEVQLAPTHRDGRPIDQSVQTATVNFAVIVADPAQLTNRDVQGGGYVEVTMRPVSTPSEATLPQQGVAQQQPQPFTPPQ